MEKKDLLAREESLEGLLYALAREGQLRDSMVFQGGGALHFVYGSQRYSDDLDFVIEDSSAFESAIDKLSRGLDTESGLLIPRLKKVDSRIPFYRLSFKDNSGRLVGKVEVLNISSYEPRVCEGRFSPLVVESPREIFTDKLVASLARIKERGSLKPTDLFDMTFLSRMYGVLFDPDLYQSKCESYGLSFDSSDFQSVRNYVADPNNFDFFVFQIRKTTLPDVFSNLKIGPEYFEEASKFFSR